MFAVEADARLVDQRGAEGMCVTESRSHGVDYLVASPEAAAVRIAAKRPRNKLGIVRPAIAGKQLIVLGDVFIHTRVNRIDTVGRSAVHVVVVVEPGLCGARTSTSAAATARTTTTTPTRPSSPTPA